ncbi:hypothetical protein PAXRUDRAFT_20080 [Paxillus rubicundulus Ve08.2h10]|uniref:Uncharacterized protein n=1 Tax=Paxillus rubicundulus Ve08.2h10 TaxID=930991 RepID=A0A0D0CFR4_9AGAM|nr:hypothetical protein PAXRUDRAFT_20080 [Paxillus rubicundulus Ve08.2h10]
MPPAALDLSTFINASTSFGIGLVFSDSCEHLLCAFAASRIGSIASSTAESHIAAIKAGHIYNNPTWFSGPHLH